MLWQATRLGEKARLCLCEFTDAVVHLGTINDDELSKMAEDVFEDGAPAASLVESVRGTWTPLKRGRRSATVAE